jgi:hypothetical protein
MSKLDTPCGRFAMRTFQVFPYPYTNATPSLGKPEHAAQTKRRRWISDAV